MTSSSETSERASLSAGVGRAGSRTSPTAQWELDHIARARRDPAAFGPLYERYTEVVWAYTLSRLGDPERAADATSQTFVQAIAALPAFRPECRGERTTFRSWLMTIAHNVVIDATRRSPVTTPLDAPAAQPWLVAPGRSPEELAIAATERDRIERALLRLPENQRQIVELRAIGMTGTEIAELLRMNLSAVKVANHRAYRRLRELLAEPDQHQESAE